MIINCFPSEPVGRWLAFRPDPASGSDGRLSDQPDDSDAVPARRRGHRRATPSLGSDGRLGRATRTGDSDGRLGASESDPRPVPEAVGVFIPHGIKASLCVTRKPHVYMHYNWPILCGFLVIKCSVADSFVCWHHRTLMKRGLPGNIWKSR
jgi:hypothetical protein